ncbi:MAG TPA: phytanoyl-CoA dioxygenase family protein [Rhizomicrobium sp.]|jgi:hypothetical protein|nr:phytanoyl-CoA dioxygenase family protein [Rhizomicrobium sp.]
MHIGISQREISLGKAALATANVFYGHAKHSIKRLFRAKLPATSEMSAIARLLHQNGYAVLPSYYNTSDCARGREEIDRLIEAQPGAVQRFGQGSDCRVYGAEHASSMAAHFHCDGLMLGVGKAYRRGDLVNFSTLAARINAVPGNLGSGQGWHRDAFHFQYKAMIYLSDVGPENGPFEVIQGSHCFSRLLLDTIVGRLDKPPRSRITTAQIQRLLAASPARARAFPAPCGTVILFDSSMIHRGMPILVGTRYALTNYYYPPESVGADLYNEFAPFATA